MAIEFQKVVLYSAVVLLVVLLVIVGIVLQQAKSMVTTRSAQKCPDNFAATAVPSGVTDGSINGYKYTCTIPSGLQGAFSTTGANSALGFNKNSTAILNMNGNTIDFSDPMWYGEAGLCNKYRWATNNNYTASGNDVIHWDGITNARSPCK